MLKDFAFNKLLNGRCEFLTWIEKCAFHEPRKGFGIDIITYENGNFVAIQDMSSRHGTAFV